MCLLLLGVPALLPNMDAAYYSPRVCMCVSLCLYPCPIPQLANAACVAVSAPASFKGMPHPSRVCLWSC